MVAGRQHLIAIQSELAGNFSQGGSLAVGRVTEPGVNIVAHHGEVRHARAEIVQVLVDFIRVTVVFCDKTEWRKRILINGRIKTSVNPVDQAGDLTPNARKQLSV